MTTDLMSDEREGLPEGWNLAPIRDLLDNLPDGNLVHQGWSPRCHTEPAALDEWGVLKTTAIQDGIFLPEYNKKLPLTLDPKPRLEVKPGDILLTCAGPRIRCGVATLVRHTRNKLIISGKMYRMRTNPILANSLYLEAFLRTPETQKNIDDMKTGISDSGMNITHERFSTLEVPLPPLPEQIRIADKLDALLSRIDAGRERLERVPKLLKRFRQSVLSAAVSGELTREWRGGGDAEWEETSIRDLAADIRYGTAQKCDYDDSGSPVLRIPNVNGGKINTDDLNTASSSRAS